METPLFLVGPTGVGKSALALAIARETGAAILSMDSMQVYRRLDLGTSKPTAQEREAIHHGGLDLVEPTELFDVAKYLDAAELFLNEVKSKPLLIVGGTGLYFRALTQGLCEVPPIDPEMKMMVGSLSLEELQRELRQRDPAICETIDLQNPRRLQRALEVMMSTGISLREWQQKNSTPLVPKFRAFFLQRTDLRERIEKRVREMWNQGWPEEVASLIQTEGAEAVSRFPAIGYRAIAHFLNFGGHREEVQESITIETWQYARRQLTWFRRESSVRPLEIAANSTMSELTKIILSEEIDS